MPRGTPGSYSGPGDTSGSGSSGASSAGGGSGPSIPGASSPQPAPTPVNTAYTISRFEVVEDPYAWQRWWSFNRDLYLGLDTVDLEGPASGNDEFFLGVGERRVPIRGGRADARTVRGQILPPLYEWMQRGRGARFAEHGVFAIARSSREQLQPMAQDLFTNYLKVPHEAVNGAAAFALGIPGDDRSFQLLQALAFDNELARETMQIDRVSSRVRAAAALGLGLLGQADPRLRRDVSESLSELLSDRELAAEVRASAALALGQCALEVATDTGLCTCGECGLGAPWTSLQAQIAFLAGLARDRSQPVLLRGCAAQGLGALMAGREVDELREVKEGVVSLLAFLIEADRREPDAVRESAVLALGRIGDADEDRADRWVRHVLEGRSASGNAFERRFALIALGRVGARPGSGEPWAEASEVRGRLLHVLSRGRPELKPWAALSLGVLGFWTRAHGGQPEAAVDQALERTLRRARHADRSACALALGMRANGSSRELLLKSLRKTKDDSTRSYLAVSLGMLRAREAIEDLHALSQSQSADAALMERCGLALGLIGDRRVLQLLHPMFDAEAREATRLGAVRAAGAIGSKDSIDSLTALLADPDASIELGNAAISALGAIGARDAIPRTTAYSCWLHYGAAPASLTNPEQTGVLDYR